MKLLLGLAFIVLAFCFYGIYLVVEQHQREKHEARHKRDRKYPRMKIPPPADLYRMWLASNPDRDEGPHDTESEGERLERYRRMK